MGLLDRFWRLKWVIEWRKGTKAVKEERWTDALSHLNEAIALNPDDAGCYFYRGLAYGGLGDLDSAIRDFKRVRSLDPNDRAVCNNLGTCYLRKNQIDAALKHYKLALGIDPRDVQAQLNVGIVYSKKAALAAPKAKAKYVQLSLGAFDQAISEDSHFPEAHRERGLLHSDQGRYSDAIDDFTRAIELDPSYAEAYHDRGSTYKELGDGKKAAEDLALARDLDPELIDSLKSRKGLGPGVT